MKRQLLLGAFLATIILGTTKTATSQAYTEGFNDITTLAGSGWFMQNNSTPVGGTNWFQGTPTTATPTPGPFNAYAGAVNSYIAANFNNTGSTGTISNWLVTPNRTYRNGDVFTFYTRRPTTPGGGTEYPDRLEVRLSTNGASTNVGTGSGGLGDFTTLLLSINPSLITGVYPDVWTQYVVTISGLPAPTSGRIAFRYFVTGAGSLGANSDYIGIDEVVYTPYVCPILTISPTTLPGGTAGSAYSQSLSQTGALGAPNYAVTAGALPPGMTLSAAGVISGTPTATGTFNFTVTVSDNSGCTGSRAYSITINCPTGGASLSAIPALCSNGSQYMLIEGSPAGGTYSGTNVSGGLFDPAGGTQTITYTVIDPYGCTQVANGTATVNTAPTVSHTPFTDLCDNGGAVTLSGGSPAGGVYSGTGVSGGQFEPSNGTQTITYTYTDGNGCSNAASEIQTVNTAPTVTQTPFTAVCDNGGLVTLSGGSPAGGSYSGTGVTGGDFDPTAGTQTLTYTYTDGNGCSNAATEIQTVNTAPTVTQTPFADLCSNIAPVTLSGGSPAGGTYSGTGVSGGDFDPASGTQSIDYTYTDANGCSNVATEVQTVNPAPTVSFTAPPNACVYHVDFALTGGSPAGGTYSGTGVTAGQFSPATAGIGTHLLTYIYTDVTTGCTDTATANIGVSICAGIEDNDMSSFISLYPNPADEMISVSFADGLNMGNWTIEIYTVEGKLVYVKEVLVNNAGHIETLNIGNYHTGSYLMVLNNNGDKVVKRFVKK